MRNWAVRVYVRIWSLARFSHFKSAIGKKLEIVEGNSIQKDKTLAVRMNERKQEKGCLAASRVNLSNASLMSAADKCKLLLTREATSPSHCVMFSSCHCAKLSSPHVHWKE